MKYIMVPISIALIVSLVTSCAQNKIFTVYYIPLEVDFFVPPSRQDIINKGVNFEIESNAIYNLFKEVKKQKGSEPRCEDYSGLRVMIVNNRDDSELFITVDKVILSLSQKKRYNISETVIDEIVEEIKDYMNKNNLVYPNRRL
jgi:hypothetical protein